MKNKFWGWFFVVSLIADLIYINGTWANPITVTGLFHYRDNRSANSVNLPAGDRLSFGAISVVPNGNNGTTGTASQGSTNTPLIFQWHSTAPDLFSYGVPYDPGLTGPWELTFANGNDQTVRQTPDVGGAPIMPFPRNVAVSGSGLTPTFSWTFPAGIVIDGVTFRIWDLGTQVSILNIANNIHSVYLSGNNLSYHLPAVLSSGQSLETGRHYAVEIDLTKARTGGAVTGLVDISSQSRAFFNFTPLPSGVTGQVFLPIVTHGGVTVFTFHAAVTRDNPTKIDPTVAVGYDYAIGTGDPNFASVTLPSGIGDGKYDLYLHNGTDFIFESQLTGGVRYDFEASGVSKFRVLGIETSALLDPADGTAFITELTFTDDGEFTGTMTVLTKELLYLPFIVK